MTGNFDLSGHDAHQASATATTSTAQPSGGLGTHFSNDQVAELFRVSVEEPQQKKVAAAAHSVLEVDILRRKGEARIAAATATPSRATKASTAATVTEDDDIIGETPPEVKAQTLGFAWLPRDEIMKILAKKSRPNHLHKLCYLQPRRSLLERQYPRH